MRGGNWPLRKNGDSKVGNKRGKQLFGNNEKNVDMEVGNGLF
jgi:hypothetical protein